MSKKFPPEEDVWYYVKHQPVKQRSESGTFWMRQIVRKRNDKIEIISYWIPEKKYNHHPDCGDIGVPSSFRRASKAQIKKFTINAIFDQL